MRDKVNEMTAMLERMPNAERMLQACLERDTAYDGLFYVCVKTTGIFCRPSCPARKPRPENVTFRSRVQDCLLDGFRPCRRCRPLHRDGEEAEWLPSLLALVEARVGERLRDADLVEHGFSPYRVRRYFQRNFGMTFQAYHRARRMGLALRRLQNGGDLLSVGLDSGFESQSGFRDAFERVFGVPPGTGRGVNGVFTARFESPLGPLIGGALDTGVCLLEFADRRGLETQIRSVQKRFDAKFVPGPHPHLDRLGEELDAYFAGQLQQFGVPCCIRGTPFQESVWRALGKIPYGRTISYGELAAQLGRPEGRRAVGRANGDNPLAIVVPCHRVVGADGKLRGYGGGLWRKQFLLDVERGGRTAGESAS